LLRNWNVGPIKKDKDEMDKELSLSGKENTSALTTISDRGVVAEEFGQQDRSG